MYVAIDIETTGLNPQTDQILEVAAVANCKDKRVIDCPTFHEVVKQERIQGTPQALSMNAELIKKISDGEGRLLAAVMWRLRNFLESLEQDEFIAVGSNVGSFDMQFLKMETGFPCELFSHRSLDINSLYADNNGVANHKGIEAGVAKKFDIPGKPHQALYDSRLALALMRSKFWGHHAK